jgi:hypothetical protein
MLVLLHAIHALHAHASKALPELSIALAYRCTPHIAVLSSIALAALAATCHAAAPSVGAYIAAKAPVTVHNMLVDVGYSGSRAPGPSYAPPSLSALLVSC